MSSGQGQAFLGAIVAGGVPAPGDTRLLEGDWTNVLAGVPLFAGLTQRHLRRVARLAERARIRRYTTLVGPTRRADAFYVILDGQADVSTANGKRVTLGPGGFFGEMALLDNSPRTATVTAKTDMLTMRISRRHFNELLESEPKIALRVLQELATRIRRVEAESSTSQSPLENDTTTWSNRR